VEMDDIAAAIVAQQLSSPLRERGNFSRDAKTI
jgi:hypothetical protein